MDRHTALLAEAQTLAEAGRFDDALARLTRVLRSEPNHPGALAGAAMTYQAKGDLVRAAYHARRALAVEDVPRMRLLVARVLEHAGDLAEARRVLAPLVEGPGAVPPACFRDAAMQCALGQADEAARRTRAWMDRWPGEAPMVQAHVKALTRLGDARAVVAALREGVARFPANRSFREWLASAANYVDDLDEAAVVDLAREHAALLPAPGPTPPRRASDGLIRVGFVSPDFRTHAVAYFLAPLLRHLDPDAVRTFCYDTGDAPDATTASLRAMAGSWRDCRGLRDDSIASLVRSDGIDVLVDLAGLTLGCTPGVFARRAAPFQVSYLGYANTTAIPAMDARIVDSHTDPPVAAWRGTERIVRLDPCFLCYQPPGDLPDVTPRPDGPVVFGSFNALLKVTPRTVDLWSRVMAGVPGSRLIVKAWGLECEATRRRLDGLFTDRGVAESRLEFLHFSRTRAEHLATYHRVDIALDTFPYHGTTTTCEALSMGVPVVSRVGEVHRARVGLSILSAVGLADLAATTDEAFVETAVGLANDPARRAAWRSAGPEGLRARLVASPLGDGPGYAQRFKALLEAL
ncbi:MAG: hypothetical protein HBSAPP03_06210 [Phycisphaerae bacterium]|nr:MAG: hypothetical protein HBSAPP03_06210 [Phycisphaerae bacterium]